MAVVVVDERVSRSGMSTQEMGWDVGLISQIHERGRDLVLCAGPSWDERCDLQHSSVSEFRTDCARPGEGQELVQAAFASLNVEAPGLAEEMAALVEAFLSQFGLPEAALRIEVSDRQGCPLFHCDYVNVRMIKTFVGQSTEYRGAGLLSRARSFPPGAIGFLKGGRHPTHRGDRLLHRSPAVEPGQRRLTLVMDY